MKAKFYKDLRKSYIFYLFIAPAMFYFLVFIVYPLIQGLLMSFQNFGLLGSKGYIGFENYRKLFNDPFFYQTILNTLIVTVGIVAGSVRGN
jgi:ABC-type sugar transport system permease subunit